MSRPAPTPWPFATTRWKVTCRPGDEFPFRAARPGCWHFPFLCACKTFRTFPGAFRYAYRAASLGL